MEKILRNIQFYFDYYIGYFLTNGNKLERWQHDMLQKYPDKFINK